MALCFIILFPCFCCLHPSPPSHSSITPSVAVVRDGGEYSGYRNSHRSVHPQSTPKHADSRQKIKGDQKKKKKKWTLSSFLLSPPPLLSQSSTILVTPSLFGPSSLLTIRPAIFHLTPFSSDNTSPISDVTFLRVCSPVQHFFHPGIQFSKSPPHLSYFYLLPIYLSPSPLCICSFLPPSAHLLLCVHKVIKHTHSYTSISLFLRPPLLFAAHIGGSVIGD